MKWLIVNDPLNGRKLIKLYKEDNVDEIMKKHPRWKVVDVAKSVEKGDN